MTGPGDITSVERARIWAVKHAERTSAQHEHQQEWNDRAEQRMTQFERSITALGLRIEKLEKRLIIVCAVAAGGGGTLGTILLKAFATLNGG